MEKLSHYLFDLGFFSVVGTSEHPGGQEEGVLVVCGTPNHYDMDNEVTVVYDDIGSPWIITTIARSKIEGQFWKMVQDYGLQKGAYVPHSKDGGNFIKKIMPGLR